MSDEEVIDTAPEAEPTTEEAAQDPLFDKLVEGIGAATGTPTDEPAEAEKPEGEKPEEPAKAAAADDWDDLSDDREWTKERHQKIREQHRADRQRVGGMLAALERKNKKFDKKRDEFRVEKNQVGLIERRIMADVDAIRSGSAEQAIAALARLGQRDPHSMYEEISLAMLGKAGQPKKDPTVAALEAKVETLTQKLEQKERAQTSEQHTTQTRREIRAVLGSAEEWPTLAAIASQSPDRAAEEFEQEYVNQSNAAGRWLDVESVADRIERRLRKSQPSRQAQNGAANHRLGREQEPRAQANPEPAQSPPRSLSPSLSAASGGARREQTEEELQAEFARNPPPGFFENLFG